MDAMDDGHRRAPEMLPGHDTLLEETEKGRAYTDCHRTLTTV